MRQRLLVLCALLLMLSGQVMAMENVWQIGVFDQSYDEFACARNYGAFPATFPQDLRYVVGQSQPERDWSFIQPGPADAWAGSREHPFVVQFRLEAVPTTPLKLVIAMVDSHSSASVPLHIRLNEAKGTFQLPVGKSDASLIDPVAGVQPQLSFLVPEGTLRQGENELELISKGSWILYDALALQLAPEEAGRQSALGNLNIQPTPLLKRGEGQEGLQQIVRMRVDVSGQPGKLTFEVAGPSWQKSVESTCQLAIGTFTTDLLLPERAGPEKVTITARMGQSAVSAEVTLAPVKRWHIFLATSAHTDIGYTDRQDRVELVHDYNTELALRQVDEYPAFAWTLETSWQAENFARKYPKAEVEKLYQRLREGRIGLNAGYLNMLTGLCSHEELNRWLYYSASLHRKYGVPFEFASTTDVPSQVWSIPTTLAAAGVKYYACGINSYRGPFGALMSGHPYWWEGPDGSKVLAYFAPGYAHAMSMLSTREQLLGWMIGATSRGDDFPWDALYAYGGISDNMRLPESYASVAQWWADEYEYPKLHIGPSEDYFHYMEANWGDTLPAIKGDAGVYWEDGAASSAWETAINRNAHELASHADSLFALTRTPQEYRPPKQRELYGLWRDILLFDEHTWGAAGSISDPDGVQTREQWEVKADFAKRAWDASERLAEEGMQRLAGQIGTAGPSVVVFNGTGWERKATSASMPTGAGRVPADPATGKPLTTVQDGAQLYFQVPSLPAWGYVSLPLVEGQPAAVQDLSQSGAPVLENARYRAEFDLTTGAISSLLDKATGRELADPEAPYGLGEYLYVSGGDDTDMIFPGTGRAPNLTVHQPTGARFQLQRLPGLGIRIIVTASCEKTSELVSTWTIWDDSPRVDLEVALNKQPERRKEAVYVAFPFNVTDPTVRLELPNGVVDAGRDMLPSACLEWFSPQHWVRVAGKDASLAWTSLDAPLVTLETINEGRWPKELKIEQGWIFSYPMNNYWPTNYKADQGGRMRFRYSFDPTAGGSDAAAARFGWQAQSPVLAYLGASAQTGGLPQQGSFVQLDHADVVVTAVKAPEEGRGLIVRLWSLAPGEVTVRLKAPLFPWRTATLCNLVEAPLGSLEVDSGAAVVKLSPQRPTTIRLE